jgi:fructokinase
VSLPFSASPVRVLVVGESLVDLVSTAGTLIPHAGGSPLNVAFGLGRLGVPTALLTEFGNDAYGTLLADHLATAGVRVIRDVGAVRATSSATAEIGTDGAARYTFDLDWSLGSLEQVPQASLIHTGSIAAVVQPGADTVLALFRSAPPDTVLSFDPNVRPEIMGDEAAVRTRIDEVARLAHVVKLSDEDAAWLYPGLDTVEICDRVLSLGAELVALTLGADGCVLATATARVHRPAPPVAVADTIGAGDSFMAALLFGLSRNPHATPDSIGRLETVELTELADVALASAAITVSRAGAFPPTLEELGDSRHP